MTCKLVGPGDAFVRSRPATNCGLGDGWAMHECERVQSKATCSESSSNARASGARFGCAASGRQKSRGRCPVGFRWPDNKAIPAEAGMPAPKSQRLLLAPRLLLLYRDCAQREAREHDCRERQADPPCGLQRLPCGTAKRANPAAWRLGHSQVAKGDAFKPTARHGICRSCTLHCCRGQVSRYDRDSRRRTGP